MEIEWHKEDIPFLIDAELMGQGPAARKEDTSPKSAERRGRRTNEDHKAMPHHLHHHPIYILEYGASSLASF